MSTSAPNSFPIASETIAPYPTNTGARAVKLFRNGANQAVRIPKEFELPGTNALVHREGNRLILEPVQDKPKRGTAAALLAALESMKDWEPIADEFPDVDAGLLPLDDVDVVLHYAQLRAMLEHNGTPIDPNDALIAAHALALDATLVSSDTEFSRVPGLKVENWLQSA